MTDLAGRFGAVSRRGVHKIDLTDPNRTKRLNNTGMTRPRPDAKRATPADRTGARLFNQLTADTNLTGKQIETDIVGDNCVCRRQR